MLRWPIYIFNLVDITKLPCYPHRRSTTVSLETFTLYTLCNDLLGVTGEQSTTALLYAGHSKSYNFLNH